MKYITFCILLFGFLSLSAQTTERLVAHISFDSCDVREDFGTPNILPEPNPNGIFDCDCGVEGEAIEFVKSGNEDSWFWLLGDIDDVFTTIDFTISFYFRPTVTASESFILLSKKTDCDATDRAFSVRFNPATRVFNVDLNESTTVTGSVSTVLPDNLCWYHVTIVRKGTVTTVYLNGEFYAQGKSTSGQRVNISNNNAILTVGTSQCNQGFDTPFKGLMDELRIYERALKEVEIKELFSAPDQIGNGASLTGVNDTTIFLGNSVQAFITNTCADDLLWTPQNGIAIGDETLPNPLIIPTETTTYSLDFSHPFCTATDSLRITVIDPDSLDCTQVFLPKAFTPNADGLNDFYGINNPFVINELISFEIFDRWGNKVFATIDPFQKWDGSYNGKALNPGVFLYKVRFLCKGEELVDSGSLTILR
jgi:gliding motility-associated-like protein